MTRGEKTIFNKIIKKAYIFILTLMVVILVSSFNYEKAQALTILSAATAANTAVIGPAGIPSGMIASVLFSVLFNSITKQLKGTTVNFFAQQVLSDLTMPVKSNIIKTSETRRW